MIYAIGDSFTYGDELSSQDYAWPALLSNKLKLPVVNQGRSATGNTRIVKRTIDAVINNATAIVIGWTECNRVEFADEIGIFDLWAGRDFRALQNDPTHRIDQIKYMTAYDTPEYHYVDWLRKIILTQSLCKLHNVNCVMFISCGANQRHQNFYHKHKTLVNAIDHSMFVDDMFTSVAEWTWGKPHGPNGHPLEAGHEIIANKIYEHIRTKCRLS